MTYDVSVSITDGNNTMTCPFNHTVSENDKIKEIITGILMNQENLILEKFPTNQWIYKWIISSNIDGSLESFFADFNVTGDRRLMDALLHDAPMSSLTGGEYVLAFEGY